MDTETTHIGRTILIIVLLILSLLAPSCLGVFQEVSLNPSGNAETFVRFTLSKATMEAIGEMGGESEDTDDLFNLEDGPFDPESIPGLTDLFIEKIDSDIDVGLSFRGTLTGSAYADHPEEAPFVPFERGDTIVIALPSLAEDDETPQDPQSEQFAAMFFASTKYQLSLDKRLYPKISSARVISSGEKFPASVTELSTSWLVEFPFSTWIQATEGCLIEVKR